jgi:PAS domain S-box-containing protein
MSGVLLPPNDQNPNSTSHAQIMRLALGLLVLLAIAVGAASWEVLRQYAGHFELIPIVLIGVIGAVAYLVYVKTKGMSELRSSVAGLQSQHLALSSEMETQKLLQTVIASRQEFLHLLDSFESATFTLSLEGKISAANKAFIDVLGMTFQEVIGQELTSLISSPTLEQLKSGLEVFEKKRRWTGLVRVCVVKTGNWRYFDCTVHPVLQGGELSAITVMADDVTADREREKQFSTLFETLQEAVWISAEDGRLLDGNKAMMTLLGVKDRAEMLGMSVLHRVAMPERMTLEQALEKREALRDLELTIARVDGTESICIATATAVFDVSGGVKFHGTFTDVTARRSVERLLAREQRFRSQLIASLPDAIVCTNPLGIFTFASGHAERMFDINATNLAEKKIYDFIDADDSTKLESMLQHALANPAEVVRTELRLRSGIIVQVVAAAVCDALQNTSDVVWSFRDVTEQRMVQQELVTSERLAAVGQMLEGFSHELNNPLTTIVGACELLKDEKLTEAGQRNLELLTSQSTRARELVRNLLLFSSPPTQGRASINIADLLQAVLTLRRNSLSAHNLTVDIRDSGGLPFTVGEPAQLMQMFLNVLVNAEQACISAGGGTIRIRVGSESGNIWCTVHDDGPGISPEDARRIFEPFFTTGRNSKRVGLGLSISRSIATAHGGSIEYKPAVDGGSVMKITLPAGSRARSNPATAGTSS